MPIIPIPVIYPSENLHHFCAVFVNNYKLFSFSFLWNFSSTHRIKYNKIKWKKNTAIHSTFTAIQASDLWRPGSFNPILSSLHLLIVDQIRLLVLGHSPHHFLQTLSVLLSLSALAGSLLSSLQLLPYPITANHLTTVQLSSLISASISLSLPQHLALFLGFFVNDLFDPFHCCFSPPLPWCFTSALWLAKMFVLYILCFR